MATIIRSSKHGELFCDECGVINTHLHGHEAYCESREEYTVEGKAVSKQEYVDAGFTPVVVVEEEEELLNDKWIKSSVDIRPAYYAKYKIDPWTFCIENGVDLPTGSVIKYVMRHQDKNGVEDINKAIKCLEMIREHYYE